MSNIALPAASAPLARMRFAHVALGSSMFLMGACGMIYEYALGVLGNNLIGSSREQIFVIIGLMMFAMGVGASWQQRIRGNLIDAFLWIELALGLLGGMSTLVIFASFAVTDSYRVVMYLFAFMIGALIGCEIPLLIRINTEFAKNLPANLSSILSMDYVGSLAGALLFTYVLLTRFPMERICLMLGGVNTCLAVGGLVFFWPMVRRRQLLLISSLATLIGLAVLIAYAGGWMATLEQRCFEDPVIHSSTTKYQHLVLTKRRDHLRLYIDGHLQFSSEDEHIYHEMLVHVPMELAAHRAKVLILGGGDGLALREVLRYSDVSQVTLVDIDAAMLNLAANQPDLVALNEAAFRDMRVHTGVPDGLHAEGQTTVELSAKGPPMLRNEVYRLAEVDVLAVDADQFLRSVNENFDVIVVDFPDPRSVELAKLYSVPFYQALAKRLAPGGMVSVQATSPMAAPLVYRCIGLTMQEAGFQVRPYHAMVPSFGDWGWHLAWTDVPADKVVREISEIQRLDVPTRYLTPEVLRASFIFGKGIPDDREPIVANTRFRPVLVDYHARSYR